MLFCRFSAKGCVWIAFTEYLRIMYLVSYETFCVPQ